MSPFGETALCISLNARGWLPSSNSRFPLPSSSGKVNVRISSTRPAASRACTSSVLPAFGIGPERSEDLVGAPPEQQLERLAEQLVELFAENRVVPQRRDPATEFEAAGGVFFRSAGGL